MSNRVFLIGVGGSRRAENRTKLRKCCTTMTAVVAHFDIE